MPTGSYKVYVDWNDDGDFDDVGEDVTLRVLDGRSAVTMQYGRDQQRALSPTAVGQANFQLNNISRDYSPENLSSPLAGQIVPARPVQITGTVGASTYTMFRGQLDDFKVQPGYNDRYINVDCIDALGALRGVSVSTSLYQGLRTGEAIGVILDEVGWPDTQRVLDAGATVMPWWWLEGADAYDSIMDLLASEGPPALVTLDSQGRIVFLDRHHRLQSSASTSVQATWRGSDVEPLMSDPTEYNHGFKEIVNRVVFELPVRTLSGVATAVWNAEGRITIADGQTMELTASSATPFVVAWTPAAGSDFTLLSGAVTVSLSRTSGQSVVIAIKATGGPAILTDLMLTGYPLSQVSTVRISRVDTGSMSKYGSRSLPDGSFPLWASKGDAAAIGDIILAQRAERLPTITVGMVSANTTRLTQQLTRNLSDRVHVVEPHTGLDADCFIEQIGHTITQGGAEHRTAFGLEKVAAQISGAFILGAGVLGTNVLGRRGFTDPSVMFVLGTQGVLGTNILSP
jgi:hypothetical protein